MFHGSYRQYNSHELIDIEFNRYIPRSFHESWNQGPVVTSVSIGNHLCFWDWNKTWPTANPRFIQVPCAHAKPQKIKYHNTQHKSLLPQKCRDHPSNLQVWGWTFQFLYIQPWPGMKGPRCRDAFAWKTYPGSPLCCGFQAHKKSW